MSDLIELRGGRYDGERPPISLPRPPFYKAVDFPDPLGPMHVLIYERTNTRTGDGLIIYRYSHLERKD